MTARSKAAAAALALAVRDELGLTPMVRLDPWALADLYGIDVLPISAVTGVPATTSTYLHETKPTLLSAALVPDGTAKFILDNDRHPRTRRAASVAHEMGHVLWEHEFTEVLITADGCRAVDRDTEEEADRLGHELLITTTAAMTLAKDQWSDAAVAQRFGVSDEYARMRMLRTGARKRAKYSVEKAARLDSV